MPVIIFFTIALTILGIIIGNKVKKADYLEKPKGLVFFAVVFVEWIDNMVESTVNKKYAIWLSPYIGSISIYLVVSNLSGLFGFNQPTRNFSVTLTLAILTWIMVQWTAIKEIKISGYFKSFVEPFAFLLIPNFFGKIAPLISLSMRLFGNILSGSIIMALLYAFASYCSNAIANLFTGGGVEVFNFLAPIIAPALHGYFDVFAGLIQMFIFITLTMVYITNEIPNQE